MFYQVYPNGTLVISDVQRKEDAATYTCVARNDDGYSARSDLRVSVMGKKFAAYFASSIIEINAKASHVRNQRTVFFGAMKQRLRNFAKKKTYFLLYFIP